MRSFFLGFVCLITFFLPGCGGKDYTYVEDHELKPGPGLFSGKDGVFTVYDGTLPHKEEAEEQEKSDRKE